ncbi:hypothetical protein M422DRAFT_267296 [Sphaerobolus stellatus SS14]|uniref:Uncharacterized protein n=1 Tax=Sphaerobolus stellatus (strain SS14) TaxID=990650 RepID=A0A0C9U9B6_SPHS4|nr:hypothetical protein M422DRAFT_267296 [Sphaerobolus stellatus SS14]
MSQDSCICLYNGKFTALPHSVLLSNHLTNDALRNLRSALGLKSFLVRRKRELASGQGVLTRSESAIARAGMQVNKWKEVYRRSRKAMIRLKGSVDSIDPKLKNLRDDDFIMLSKWMEQHRYWQSQGERAEAEAVDSGNGGRTELPWIWKMNQPVEGNDSIAQAIQGCTSEAIRLEWVHARASRNRFLEELKLLRAESERVVKAFRHFEMSWKNQGERCTRKAAKEEAGETKRVCRGTEVLAKRQQANFYSDGSLRRHVLSWLIEARDRTRLDVKDSPAHMWLRWSTHEHGGGSGYVLPITFPSGYSVQAICDDGESEECAPSVYRGFRRT